MARLKEMLHKIPDTPVQITNGTDDICKFCPHMDDGGCIRPGQQADEIDLRALKMLGLEDGAMGTWSGFVDLVREKIEPEAVPGICHGCNWVDLGFCVNGVAALSG
jgi:hypothetical protein